MAKPVRASKRAPCPICGKKGWPCYMVPSGEVAYCESVVSDATDRGGLYRHFLVERDRLEWKPRPAPRPCHAGVTAPSAVASPEHLHLIYNALLNRLGLSHTRRSNLIERGLSEKAIDSGLYRDTPTREESDEIARLLEPLGLAGVPGFYYRGGRWRLVSCFPGFFVPYTSAQGLVRGLSYRLDSPLTNDKGKAKVKYLWVSSDPEARFDDGGQKYLKGTKLTPPLHFTGAAKLNSAREICLTEGALKSDVASHLLGVPFIGAGGVTQWGEGFAANFKRHFPAARAVLCFDSDWRTNKDVRLALEKLMAHLRDAGVRYVVRSWPQHSDCKGIDDLALALAQSSGKGVLAA